MVAHSMFVWPTVCVWHTVQPK